MKRVVIRVVLDEVATKTRATVQMDVWQENTDLTANLAVVHAALENVKEILDIVKTVKQATSAKNVKENVAKIASIRNVEKWMDTVIMVATRVFMVFYVICHAEKIVYKQSASKMMFAFTDVKQTWQEMNAIIGPVFQTVGRVWIASNKTLTFTMANKVQQSTWHRRSLQSKLCSESLPLSLH